MEIVGLILHWLNTKFIEISAILAALMQVFVAGFSGSLAYLIIRKPSNGWMAMGTIAIGTVSAAYLTPLATLVVTKWFSLALTEQAKLALGFLIGIGGMSVVNIVVMTGEWVQKHLNKILSRKF